MNNESRHSNNMQYSHGSIDLRVISENKESNGDEEIVLSGTDAVRGGIDLNHTSDKLMSS